MFDIRGNSTEDIDIKRHVDYHSYCIKEVIHSYITRVPHLSFLEL